MTKFAPIPDDHFEAETRRRAALEREEARLRAMGNIVLRAAKALNEGRDLMFYGYDVAIVFDMLDCAYRAKAGPR